MDEPELTPEALARIDTARFFHHLTLVIEEKLGIKLKVRQVQAAINQAQRKHSGRNGA